MKDLIEDNNMLLKGLNIDDQRGNDEFNLGDNKNNVSDSTHGL